MSWTSAAIGDVFEVARGGSPRPIDKFITDDPDGLNWVMIGDASASSKYISSTKKKIRPEGLSKTRAVKPGDFLLTNSMSFGRPYIMATHGCIHDGWLVLSPKSESIDADYIYHLLGTDEMYQRFASRAAGATVKNLNSGIVREVEIPLPPLEEQKRIAAILDKADELRRLRRRAIDRLDTLAQSIFYDMFGDPGTAVSKKLSDLSELINGDRSSKYPKVEDIRDSGVPFFGTPNIEDGSFLRQGLRYISQQKFAELSRGKTQPNDILITLRGTLGQTCIIPEDIERGFINAQMLIIRTGSEILPQYLNQYLNMPVIQRTIRSSNTGTAVPQLTAAQLSKFEILVPSLRAQQSFVGAVAVASAKRGKQLRALEIIHSLFSSLQQRAFRGEL